MSSSLPPEEFVIRNHGPLAMTYIENDMTAESIFGSDVTPARTLLAALEYTPFDPDFADPKPFGVDISVYNGSTNFGKMVSYHDGFVKYVIVRAGQSWGYEDPNFVRNWLALKEVGLPRMIYYVIFPGESVPDQVAKFMEILAKVNGDYGEGPIWIDLELHHNQSANTINAKTWQMVELLREKTSHRVGIYSGDWFLSGYCLPAPSWWTEIDWWLAQYLHPQYGKEHPGPPARPVGIPEERVIFHQTSSYIAALPMGALGDGNIRIDGNRYLGDKFGIPLHEYLNIPEPPPTPTPQGDLEERLVTIEKNIENVVKRLDKIDTIHRKLREALED